jgi:hypothetical protein
LTTIWLTYLVVATVASGIFVAAGWRGSKKRNASFTGSRDKFPADPLWENTEGDQAALLSQADIGVALRLAIKRLSPVMTNKSVQADIAVPPALLVRMHPPILADLLEELLTAAIHGAPASRLLLTAATHGERTYVTVTDDMPGADLMVRKASVRGLSERMALRGGVLDVDVTPMEGTSMTLRFAAVLSDQLDPIACAPATVRKPLPTRPVPAASQPAG